jgi:hypothetical protein
VTAFLGALLGILLNPLLQHRTWKRQRLADARYTTVTEVNRLATEFIVNYPAKDSPDLVSPLGEPFYQSWQAAAFQVEDYFTESTCRAFNKMHYIILTSRMDRTQKPSD